jgi:endoglucanase
MAVSQTVLPKWRGFNLLEMFWMDGKRKKGDATPGFVEDDFAWMADWGFNFVRLPMSYRFWVVNNDPSVIDEPVLEKIDAAIEMGRKHGIHVCLNFHRGPGYCVSRSEEEPFNLWKDAPALSAFVHHWKIFANRYKGISSDVLSFNLINEPSAPSDDKMTRQDHERVIRAAVNAIREIDSKRLIIADGVSWGNEPLPELADLGIAQSCRAYIPMAVSHYKAEWVNARDWKEPSWPCVERDGKLWDKKALKQHYKKWADLAKTGVGVHCGEGGAYNHTPHKVFLAWLKDVLDILSGFGIGLALWNFRGGFGVLDSGRADVDYEDWHGHKLDGKLLKLLQEHKVQ